VLIQEWSHYPEGYALWGLGLLAAAYAVKFFSYSGRKIYTFISFLLLFVGLNFYQINIQLFVLFGALILMLENEFCFTGKLFVRAAKLFVIAILAALSNILILKGLQFASIAAAEARDVTTDQFSENARIIVKMVLKELSGFPYTLVGVMVWACIVLFAAYVAVALSNKQRALSGVVLMAIFGVIGFLSTFGLHLVSSTVWAVPRTLVGIAFIISALCIAIAYNNGNKKGGAILLTILSVAFLVNVYHVQAMSVNQYANNRLDQDYAMNVSYEIKRYEQETGEEVKRIAFCLDSNSAYAYYGNIRYVIADMNERAARTEWANAQLISYYARRNFEKVEMDENVYNESFKDKNWDFFIAEEQMVFRGDTVYIAVY
jgi:hypothetical protein